jgi:hypothetical protein
MTAPQNPANRVENFLRRWSQRKQAADVDRQKNSEKVESADTGRPAALVDPAPEKLPLPSFDPATLPPLDSITATSDIRKFLAPDVPEELTREALRRAWLADPAIRNFVGLAENQWDFGKPDGVPGFGSLELTPQLRDTVARLVGDAPCRPESEGQHAEGAENLPAPASLNRSSTQFEPPLPTSEPAEGANNRKPDGTTLEQGRHRHGTAIPE